LVLIHATTVDIAGAGVLLLGPSGAGKSDLALRVILEGALLVSDDQTDITLDGDFIHARAPATISGLLEVRGVGLTPAPTISRSRVRMAALLVSELSDRLPEPRHWSPPDLDAPRVPLVEIMGREASASAKLRLALHVVLKA
jgi:hypothetical protein